METSSGCADKDGKDELILGSGTATRIPACGDSIEPIEPMHSSYCADDHHVYAYELPLADLVRVDLPRPMELYDQMLALVLKRTWKMPQEVHPQHTCAFC